MAIRTWGEWDGAAFGAISEHILDPSPRLVFAEIFSTLGVLHGGAVMNTLPLDEQRREFGLLVGCTICNYILLLLG
jgi:hypothetical protein